MAEKRPSRAIARLLRAHESFVICGHVRPDADCIGSQLALFHALTRLTRRVAARAGVSRSVARTANQWVAVLMAVLAVAAFAGLTGISSEFTTLTISGIAGLALTLALQSTLSNVISGILMLQDGVLRLGDDIEFASVRGEVVKLSLRTTWLKRQDGVIAVVGNTNLAAGPIVNHSARERLEKKLQD
jgi:small conductance mechanosensitive channel